MNFSNGAVIVRTTDWQNPGKMSGLRGYVLNNFSG